MIDSLEYRIGHASETEIAAHLRACNSIFLPPLCSQVDVSSYSQKIVDKAQRFEVYVNTTLVGLVAIYCNLPDRRTAFITSVSVLPSFQRRGIASRLMHDCITHVKLLGFAKIELEVEYNNERAIALYAQHGFTMSNKAGEKILMVLDID